MSLLDDLEMPFAVVLRLLLEVFLHPALNFVRRVVLMDVLKLLKSMN